MGTSGALIAPLVADKLNKKLALCRKPGERKHSSYSYEGPETINNYIIIDDLTDTGDTIRNIMDAINKRESYSPGTSLCYSIIFYHAQSLGSQAPVIFPPVEEKRAFNSLIIPTFSFRLID